MYRLAVPCVSVHVVAEGCARVWGLCLSVVGVGLFVCVKAGLRFGGVVGVGAWRVCVCVCVKSGLGFGGLVGVGARRVCVFGCLCGECN